MASREIENGLLDTNLGGEEEYSREEERKVPEDNEARRRRRFSRSSPGRSWNPSLEKEEEVEVEVEEEERRISQQCRL